MWLIRKKEQPVFEEQVDYNQILHDRWEDKFTRGCLVIDNRRCCDWSQTGLENLRFRKVWGSSPPPSATLFKHLERV